MTGRVLVIGAAGRLGAAIVSQFRGRDVVAHDRRSLDIRDHVAVRRVVASARPAAIINCAAFNMVDAAQDEPSEALAVNALAVRALAHAADEAGATLVHYGTDFVFDGSATEPYTEDSAPAPKSTYAQSKLLGEWFALEAQRGFVLRVESLFGAPRGWSGRAGSLDQMIAAMKAGKPVRAFTDRIVSPSYVEDVAQATDHLLRVGAAPGLYHCVNSGFATWYAVAQAAARLLGIAATIEPSTMAAQAFAAPRPKYCALDNRKLAAAGFTMPSWENALARWVASASESGGTIQ